MPVTRPPVGLRSAPGVADALAGRTAPLPPSSVGGPFSKEEWHSMTSAQRLWAMTQAQRIWRTEGPAYLEAQARAEASGVAGEPFAQTVPSPVNRGVDFHPTTHAVSYNVSVNVTADEFAAFTRFREVERSRLLQSSRDMKEKIAAVPDKTATVPEKTPAVPDKTAGVPEKTGAVSEKGAAISKKSPPALEKTPAVPISPNDSKHRSAVKQEDLPSNDLPTQPVIVPQSAQPTLVVPSNLVAPLSVGGESHEKNVSAALVDWPYTNCPKYDGAVTVDVCCWLGKLKVSLITRMVCPSIWHKIGLCLLTGKAFQDLQHAFNESQEPTSWDAFALWLIQLNSHCVNQQTISDQYDRLRQGPDETCTSFHARFREWQLLAKTHKFSYEPTRGFVSRLTPGLGRKVSSKVYSEERRGSPMSFEQVVAWARHADDVYRSRFAQPAQPGPTPTLNKRLLSPGSETDGSTSAKRKHQNGDYDIRPCYNCNQEGHASANCLAPKSQRHLKYEAHVKRQAGTYGSRVATTSSSSNV